MGRIFAVCIYVVVFVLVATLVGGLTSSMTSLNLLTNRHSHQFAILRRFLLDKGITHGLATRIHHNARYALAQQERIIDEEHVDLLLRVSEPLRMELHFEMYIPVLSQHPFFSCYSFECPLTMHKMCHHATSMLQLSCGDIIFSVGEIPANPKVIFTVSGILTYMHFSFGNTELPRGHWAAEANLWTAWMHVGTLRASVYGQICTLDSKQFQEIASQFDSVRFSPRQYAKCFVELLNVTEALSDLSPEDAECQKLLASSCGVKFDSRCSSEIPMDSQGKSVQHPDIK